MQLKDIPFTEGLSQALFTENYIKPKLPVIIKDFIITGSPALTKWNYPFFKEVAGNTIVSVHGSEDAHPDRVTSPADSKMTFTDYLTLIENQPSQARLFIFNLLLDNPELKKDLQVTKIAGRLLTWLPFMFFGGKGSSVRYHYDIDMSHVFLSQFEGEKKVYLFENNQSPFLYRLPYNFHGLADLRNPDYEKFPALKYLNGWECTLRFGETLFIPAGYWHYIQYETQGYSVSYRALTSSLIDKWKGLRNIIIIRRIDNIMRILFKERWYHYKINTAIKKANKAIHKLESEQQNS